MSTKTARLTPAQQELLQAAATQHGVSLKGSSPPPPSRAPRR